MTGSLPDNPDRDQQNADDKWRNYFCCFPLCSYASSEGEWNKNTCQHGNQQNVANDVQMPEQFYNQLPSSQQLEGALVRFKRPGLFRASLDDKEDCNKRKGTHGIDDSKHANAPLPRGGLENGISQVAVDPGIYLKKIW